MQRLFVIGSRIPAVFRYAFLSGHRGGHGIHSPGVFEFVTRVLFDRSEYPVYHEIDEYLKKLQEDNQVITSNDFKSTSLAFDSDKRTVSKISRKVAIPPKYGRLLLRTVRYYQYRHLVELGTSLGVSALYLSSGNDNSRLVTMEGNPQLALAAGNFLQASGKRHIEIINLPFEEALMCRHEAFEDPDLVFIDGDHRKESTLEYYRYFRSRIRCGFIFIDDINWSAGMRKAWNTIIKEEKEGVTIDIFRMGIVMIRESITPGHYLIRF